MVSTTFAPPDIHTTTVSDAVTSMQPPPGDRDGFNTTVVIIVVSTIGAVLVMAIILAVIFLKRPKVERVEHVYAIPTPRDVSPGSPPNSDSPMKHERPVLKDCYCAVADAIPSPRMHISPTSPGYAEVEDVCKGENCRWDPHKFTFGPTILIRPSPPSDLPLSKTSPNISRFALTNPPGQTMVTGPTHNRTFSDSAQHRLFPDSPYINRSARTTRSFRDPKTTDYENIVIDEKNQSPCFVRSDQNYLLQARLGRVAKNPSQGVQCIQVKPPEVPSTEALYATSNVVNHSGPKTHALLPGHYPGAVLANASKITGVGLASENKSVNKPEIYSGIDISGKHPEVRNSENNRGTRVHGSKGHRKQRSKGDNSLTGESPLYENHNVVKS